jgi:hypothetical protein
LEERLKNNQTLQNQKMTGITMYLSTITLHVNGFNSPNKKHRLVGSIKKQDPTIFCLQEMHLTAKDKI